MRIVRVAFCLSAALVSSCTWSPPRPPPLVGPALVGPEPPAKATDRRYDVALTPHRDATGAVSSLDVKLAISGYASKAPLELSMREEHEGETGWPEALGDFVASDDSGPLHFVRTQTKDDGQDAVAWRSESVPTGVVHIAYAVRVPKAGRNAFGGLREHEGGFQGTGSVFLPLMHDEARFATQIAWNLADLPSGSRAVTSFGEGTVETAGTLDRVGHAMFMAGPLGQLEIDRGHTHFRGAWLGKPAFDPSTVVAWSAKAREVEQAFFHDSEAAPFSFFIRTVPNVGPTWVGTGRTGGFLFLAGDELPWERPARFAIAHELVHHWIGGSDAGIRFEGPEGSAYWFTEGFTVYYTSALMLRSGLATPSEVGDDLRERTTRFALSPVNTAPNEEIVKGFWTQREFQRLPYDRGLLYAAEIDALVRERSHGARSLDDLVLALLARASEGRAQGPDEIGEGVAPTLPKDAFRELVGAELGADAKTRYDAVVERGERPHPPSSAFGPCFKSTKKRLARFALGFSEASFKDHKIQGLVHGSAADRAGLREGESFTVVPFSPETIHKKLVFTVQRNGKPTTISYYPEGETVEAEVFDRDPKVPDERCAAR